MKWSLKKIHFQKSNSNCQLLFQHIYIIWCILSFYLNVCAQFKLHTCFYFVQTEIRSLLVIKLSTSLQQIVISTIAMHCLLISVTVLPLSVYLVPQLETLLHTDQAAFPYLGIGWYYPHMWMLMVLCLWMKMPRTPCVEIVSIVKYGPHNKDICTLEWLLAQVSQKGWGWWRLVVRQCWNMNVNDFGLPPCEHVDENATHAMYWQSSLSNVDLIKQLFFVPWSDFSHKYPRKVGDGGDCSSGNRMLVQENLALAWMANDHR